MRKKLSQKSRAALMSAKASLAIEGLYLTPQEDQLLLERTKGRMKNSDFLARALEMAKNV